MTSDIVVSQRNSLSLEIQGSESPPPPFPFPLLPLHACVCTRSHARTSQEMVLAVILPALAVHLVSDRVSHSPKTPPLGWADWLSSLRNPPVPASLTLGLYMCTIIPGFFCEFWFRTWALMFAKQTL